MITVVVDRDSVAAGDDAWAHGELWEFPDTATLGDVVVRIVDDHFLAHVAGSVAWTILASNAARVDRDQSISPDGWRYYAGSISNKRTDEIVRLFVVPLPSGLERVSVYETRAALPRTRRVVEAIEPNSDGWYVVIARYDSGGAIIPWETYRSRVRGAQSSPSS